MSEIAVSVQNITPQCRLNRSSFGALGEAMNRIEKAYLAYHNAPDNADVTWRISLTRIDGKLP